MAARVLFALLVPCVARPPTVKLRNGIQMPLLSAGVWQYNSSEARASISTALQVGFTGIDTALDYGNQDGVGAALKDVAAKGIPREQVFVETKVPGCGLDKATVNPFTCYKDTQKNLEKDLELLNLSYVDLVIVHFPPLPSMIVRSCNSLTGGCAMVRSQWKAMVEFYKAGKAKAIGVSNYCPSCFDCLKDTDVFPMVNQVQIHAGMGPDPAGIVSYGHSKGVVTQAYSALGGKPGSQHADDTIIHGNMTTAIAKAHNVSTVQVALKFLVSNGIPAVTKSSNPEHLASDLDLWSWDMTSAELEQLNALRLPGWWQKYSFACSKMEDSFVV